MENQRRLSRLMHKWWWGWGWGGSTFSGFLFGQRRNTSNWSQYSGSKCGVKLWNCFQTNGLLLLLCPPRGLARQVLPLGDERYQMHACCSSIKKNWAENKNVCFIFFFKPPSVFYSSFLFVSPWRWPVATSGLMTVAVWQSLKVVN